MPLRIAFDLDGVLADMDGELVRQAERLFGETMTKRLLDGAANETAPQPSAETASAVAPADTPIGSEAADSDLPFFKLQMTTRQQRRLWRHIESIDNFWESLKEIEPGAVKKLAELATERGWEIIFLTRRPPSAGATSQLQSQRWLQAMGFTFPSVYVVQRSRGRIAAALGLDFVIDDTPENCLDVVVDSRARAVLVWREDERHLPAAARRLGIGVVKSVDECLGILAQVETPAREGALDRVLRLLGLKEPA